MPRAASGAIESSGSACPVFRPESVRLCEGVAQVSQDAPCRKHPHGTELENLMRATCLSAITAAVTLALVTGCGATDQPDGQGTAPGIAPDVVQDTVQVAAPDVAGITAAIEAAGFTCEVKERHPDKFVQVVDCRSSHDKYQKLIASEWEDATARDKMYQDRMPGMCGALGLKDQVRWSTAGNWALVAGGGTETDVAALSQATDALGFEPHAVPCQ